MTMTRMFTVILLHFQIMGNSASGVSRLIVCSVSEAHTHGSRSERLLVVKRALQHNLLLTNRSIYECRMYGLCIFRGIRV